MGYKIKAAEGELGVKNLDGTHVKQAASEYLLAKAVAVTAVTI